MTWVFIDIFSYNCLCFDWFYWSYEHMTRIERKKGQEMQSFGTVCILNVKSTSHFFIWLLYSALNVFHSSGVHWDDSRRQSNRLTCFERFCLSSFFFFFWCAHGLGFQAIWTPRWAPPIEKSNEAHARIFNDNFSKRASMGFGVRQKTNICTEVSAALKLTST